jgi:sugar phosphate isomerase/epimerase
LSVLRYAYVTNGLTDHRIGDALELLAEHGYRGVALTLDHVHFDPMGPRLRARTVRLRSQLERHGLACVVETGARFLLDPRRKHFPTLLSEGRERRMELLCRAIDVAAELEAAVVSMWSGAIVDHDAARAWDLLVDGMARVLEYAARNGIVLGFEPEPGMLVERLADYEELRRRLSHPAALGLTLDVGHAVWGEPMSPGECIRRGAPTLAHVHIDDGRRGVHEHLMFGDGEVDLDEALSALVEVRYEGLVAVELPRHAHAAHAIVPRAMAALRAAEREHVDG